MDIDQYKWCFGGENHPSGGSFFWVFTTLGDPTEVEAPGWLKSDFEVWSKLRTKVLGRSDVVPIDLNSISLKFGHPLTLLGQVQLLTSYSGALPCWQIIQYRNWMKYIIPTNPASKKTVHWTYAVAVLSCWLISSIIHIISQYKLYSNGLYIVMSPQQPLRPLRNAQLEDWQRLARPLQFQHRRRSVPRCGRGPAVLFEDV